MTSNFMSCQVLPGLEPAAAYVTGVVSYNRRVYVNNVLFEIVIGTVGFAAVMTSPSPAAG